MAEKPIREETAPICCSAETRELIRSLKRGGETYDGLLQRMAAQYDPNAADRQEEVDGAV